MPSGILTRVKLHQLINSVKTFQDVYNDIQLSIQNSPSIVGHISSSNWLQFVKSICNHSIFPVFSSGSVFQWFQFQQADRFFDVYLFIN